MNDINDFIAAFKTLLYQKFNKDLWVDPKHTPNGNLLIKSHKNDRYIIIKPIESMLSVGAKRVQDFINNTPTFKKKSIDNYIFVARRFNENAIKLANSNKQLTLISVDFINKSIIHFGIKNIEYDISKAVNELSNNIGNQRGSTVNTQKEPSYHAESKPHALLSTERSHRENELSNNNGNPRGSTVNTKKKPSYRAESKPYALINTERSHRENEEPVYFLCPKCGVNLSVPEKYRKYDCLKCCNCDVTFKSPIFYPGDRTIINKIKVKKNKESDYWQEYNRKYPNFKYVLIIAFVVFLIYIIGLFSTPDPEYDSFIETRARMYMLKERGLVTDRDIKDYEDAFYESRRKKKK